MQVRRCEGGLAAAAAVAHSKARQGSQPAPAQGRLGGGVAGESQALDRAGWQGRVACRGINAGWEVRCEARDRPSMRGEWEGSPGGRTEAALPTLPPRHCCRARQRTHVGGVHPPLLISTLRGPEAHPCTPQCTRAGVLDAVAAAAAARRHVQRCGHSRRSLFSPTTPPGHLFLRPTTLTSLSARVRAFAVASSCAAVQPGFDHAAPSRDRRRHSYLAASAAAFPRPAAATFAPPPLPPTASRRGRAAGAGDAGGELGEACLSGLERSGAGEFQLVRCRWHILAHRCCVAAARPCSPAISPAHPMAAGLPKQPAARSQAPAGTPRRLPRK